MFKNLKISFFLASKSIARSNKGTLVLIILIMTLTSINLVFTSSILLGIVDTMNRQAIDNLFGNIVIEPEKGENYIKQTESIQDLINAVPGVVGSSAHYISGAILSYSKSKNGKDTKSGGWLVKSINPKEEMGVTKIHQAIIAGEYLDKIDLNKIILGKEISGEYGAHLKQQSLGGVKVGDKIKVVFINGIQKDYEVKGVFDTKNVQADTIAYISEKEMESVLGLQNMSSEIIIKIDQTGKEDEYIKEFRRIGLLKEDIKPWTDYMGMTTSVAESFGMIKSMLMIIGLLVAGATIFIIIFVNVVNRRKQIGILKAIGVEEKIITGSYILQALFYAVLGIGLGLILIYFLIIPYFIKNPLDFLIGLVSLSVTRNDLIVISISLIIAAVIGGLVPSWRATKRTIIEAIWGNP